MANTEVPVQSRQRIRATERAHLVASVLIVGCAPIVDVEKVDAATAPKLRTQVPGYEPEDGKTI